MTTIVTPPPAIGRDRYGRPLVVPPEGGKAVPYTRCTTYIDVLEDKFNLQKWMQRMVALGLSSRPDLMLSVLAHKDDKRELDRICDSAKEAASATAAATTGTALHALTELVDRGQELPPLPANAKASLDAYTAATRDLKAKHIEQFCVLDHLKIGGTPDRVVEYQGERYIADLKTGSIEYGALKIAMQMAVYARSKTYDIATSQRGHHEASLSRALIIHLPAADDPADAACTLHWVDIVEGWYAVQVAGRVREKRQLKFKDLTASFATKDPFKKVAPRVLEPNEVKPMTLEDRIRACVTAEDVRALWQAYATTWTDDLTKVARAHIASLDVAS